MKDKLALYDLTKKDADATKKLFDLIEDNYSDVFDYYESLANDTKVLVDYPETSRNLKDLVIRTATAAYNLMLQFWEDLKERSEGEKNADKVIDISRDILNKGQNYTEGYTLKILSHCLGVSPDGAPSGKIEKTAIQTHLFKYVTYHVYCNTSANHTPVAKPTAAGSSTTKAN